MSNVYEASVYTREITYRNFNGLEKTVKLHFAIDPLKLLQVLAGLGGKTVKSGNPAKNGRPAEISDSEQLQFVRDLAIQSAGFPSSDGESWEPFEEFEDSIAGKAFLTKLTSSDGDRREFSEKVILDPFRAFVGFASNDPSNSPKEVQEFQTMLAQLERLFTVQEKPEETLEEKRARLAAEMAALEGPAEGTQGVNV